MGSTATPEGLESIRSLPPCQEPTRRVRGHSQVFNESIALPLRLYMYR
jgi:hypothetical protein